MSHTASSPHDSKLDDASSLIERIGKKIPDPIVIFMSLLVIACLLSMVMGGYTFTTLGADGSDIEYSIQNMLSTENIRWIFDNAIFTNWMAYGHGVLGIILICVLGVGIACLLYTSPSPRDS